jgi:hypothetical protein
MLEQRVYEDVQLAAGPGKRKGGILSTQKLAKNVNRASGASKRSKGDLDWLSQPRAGEGSARIFPHTPVGECTDV